MLKFVQISHEDRNYIKQYVREKVTKGISPDERKDLVKKTETGLRRKVV